MVAAAPGIVSASAGVMRGLLDTTGVQGRIRFGGLSTGKPSGKEQCRRRLPCGALQQARK
jgi:type IV secretion system protein VirB6